jgi:hypothetical protein
VKVGGVAVDSLTHGGIADSEWLALLSCQEGPGGNAVGPGGNPPALTCVLIRMVCAPLLMVPMGGVVSRQFPCLSGERLSKNDALPYVRRGRVHHGGMTRAAGLQTHACEMFI